MRISDFTISRCSYRREQWKLRSVHALVLGLPDEMVITTAQREAVGHGNANMMLTQTRELRCVVFNINALSDQQSLWDFRFKKTDVGRIKEMIEWGGVASQNEYACHPLTGTCLFLQRLATTVLSVYVEKNFGMFSSKMSAVFWELAEELIHKFGYVLDLSGASYKRDRKHILQQLLKLEIPCRVVWVLLIKPRSE